MFGKSKEKTGGNPFGNDGDDSLSGTLERKAPSSGPLLQELDKAAQQKTQENDKQKAFNKYKKRILERCGCH